jgi:SAM-dependent methyltransferase
VTYLAGDAAAIPLGAGQCGSAWLSTVIHHIPDLRACARELRRVLYPGERVLIRSAFPGRLDGITLFRFFPEARQIAESFPSIAATVEAFATAGFAPEALESVPQVTADSLRAWCERVRLRADSTLQPLDDAVFARRLAEAERAAVEEPVARPVVDRLDLLVLRLGHRL